MELSILNHPTLFSLYFKVIYFSFFSAAVGWGLAPRYLMRRSRVGSWLAWIAIGISTLLLTGFSLVRLNIPGKWSVIVGLGIFVIRGVSIYCRKSQWVSGDLDAPMNIRRELIVFVSFSLLIVSGYFSPFLKNKTSGFYAYGGGDQSSYFRFSELMVDSTIADEVKKWGISAPLKEFDKAHFMRPEVPNWSINFLTYYIEFMGLTTFANQTVAIPFLAMGGEFTEESYTAAIALYLILVCWAAGLLASRLLGKDSNIWALAPTALVVSASCAPLSLCLKHAIPALVAWGFVLTLLSILYEACESPARKISIIGVSTLICGAIFMYLPALLIVGPVLAFGAVYYLKRERMRGWLNLGAIVLTILAIGNTGFFRPFKLLFFNSTGSLLDYGLTWKMNFIAFVGLCNFETLMTERSIISELTLFCGLVISSGFFVILFKMNRINRVLTISFFSTFAMAIFLYMTRVGHYHVIRLIEFSSIVFVGLLSLVLFQVALKNLKNKEIIKMFSILPFALASYVGTLASKEYVNTRTSALHSEPRASFKGSDSLVMARAIESKLKTQKANGDQVPAFVYWMNWGPIQFANNEILFRKVPFLEAFDYDYSYRNFDILAADSISGAFLVFPKPILPTVLATGLGLNSVPYMTPPGFDIYKTDFGQGVALVGTGWVPEANNGPNLRWTLRDNLEAGLLVWSDKEIGPLKIEIEYFPSGQEVRYLNIRRGEPHPIDIHKFIRYENGGKGEGLEKNNYFGIDDLNFIIDPSRGDKNLKLDFVMYAKKGINVIRFFLRDKYGSRGGRVPFSQVDKQEDFYLGHNKIQMIVVTKVGVEKLSKATGENKYGLSSKSSELVDRNKFMER